MDMSYEFATVDEALPVLGRYIVQDGEEVGSRLGERVMEVLHPTIKITQPMLREVLNPGRKASIYSQLAETAWVLAGRNDVGWLSHYLPRAPEFSDDGTTWRGGYGPRLRAWPRRDGSDDVLDQLRHVVDLLRSDRTTRRAVITIYDPVVDSAAGKDVPCNNWLHFTSRLGRLDLHVATRSNDLWWGWSGINTFEWSVLLEVVAHMVGVQPGTITYSISSLHVYDRHWSVASKLEKFPHLRTLVPSPAYSPPPLEAGQHPVDQLDELLRLFFTTENLLRQVPPSITPEDLVDFPEPMLRSWLYVLGYRNTGDYTWLDPIIDTRLGLAVEVSPQVRRMDAQADAGAPRSVVWTRRRTTPTMEEYTRHVTQLHAEKHAVYGDSWKRRGEKVGIQANIARKVDRLGVAGGGDTAADTAIDMLVYVLKYRLWLRDKYGDQLYPLPALRNLPPSPTPLSDQEAPVALLLKEQLDISFEPPRYTVHQLVARLVAQYNQLEEASDSFTPFDKDVRLKALASMAYDLGWLLWQREAQQQQQQQANATRRWQGYDMPEGPDAE